MIDTGAAKCICHFRKSAYANNNFTITQAHRNCRQPSQNRSPYF